ncbi:NXPE3 [Branchiostoma lanceolatum]|uniref:NXPE3 protein n=1 Tax=Branchiostoma lanceolatum TaxID=7740 RepID=A0A8J9ZZK8_BRALA|nr:NXPE3 [Branchiostoma lanceolatum]
MAKRRARCFFLVIALTAVLGCLFLRYVKGPSKMSVKKVVQGPKTTPGKANTPTKKEAGEMSSHLSQIAKTTKYPLSQVNKQNPVSATKTTQEPKSFLSSKTANKSTISPFNKTPKKSEFTAEAYAKRLKFSLQSNSGADFTVGDTIRVVFMAKDQQNNAVTTNIGDYFRASISTLETKSGAVGTITDHQNGTYTAAFRLLWAGEVKIKVQLVLPRQAIDVIERTIREHPFDKVMFRKRYLVGRGTIDTRCNVDPGVFDSAAPVCNYSDPRAGGRWYCEKAVNIPCKTPGYHSYILGGGAKVVLRPGEEKLFGRRNNAWRLDISGAPSTITVKKGLDVLAKRRRCMPGLATPQINGFYQQGVWNSLVCHNRHFSNQSEWRECLRGKTLHFMGDSTIRQWYEHLVKVLNLTDTALPEATHQSGPLLAQDPVNNITLKHRIHGPPIRTSPTNTSNLKYIANAIDEIKGGPNDVVGITIWSHFTANPVELYRERMEAIRAAIRRLQQRSPQTLVVIKSANTFIGNEVNGADWLAYRFDLVMRELFEGMDVALVDAWEMTSGQQWHEDVIHPTSDIITQEVEFLCSFICPL